MSVSIMGLKTDFSGLLEQWEHSTLVREFYFDFNRQFRHGKALGNSSGYKLCSK
jgi:hypothetical protein